MKLCTTLLFLLALAFPVLAVASERVPASAGDLVGSWSLNPVQTGEAAAGPGSITLVLTLDQGKLAGVALIPLPGAERRWPLVDPSLDGKTFSFKVDNGETLLAGEMKLVDGKFEGRWVAAGGDQTGRLTMTRKAD